VTLPEKLVSKVWLKDPVIFCPSKTNIKTMQDFLKRGIYTAETDSDTLNSTVTEHRTIVTL